VHARIKTRPRSCETAAIHDQVNRSGAGVLLLCTSSRRILLGKRGPDCANALTWAPFGGMVEPHENPHEGALRELYEEAGIRTTLFSRSPIYVNEDIATGFRFYTFLGLCAREPQVMLNEESSGYGWFKPYTADMPAPQHPGFAEAIQSAAVRAWLEPVLTLS